MILTAPSANWRRRSAWTLTLRAHYHLGQAIRQQIERNKFKRAEEVLRIYLMKGAPLGHEDEVREFLGSRKRQETTSR